MAFKNSKGKWNKIVNSSLLYTLLEGELHFEEVWTTFYKQIISLSPYNYPFNPPAGGIVLSYIYIFHSVFVHYIWYFRSQRTVTLLTHSTNLYWAPVNSIKTQRIWGHFWARRNKWLNGFYSILLLLFVCLAFSDRVSLCNSSVCTGACW